MLTLAQLDAGDLITLVSQSVRQQLENSPPDTDCQEEEAQRRCCVQWTENYVHICGMCNISYVWLYS